jgi:lipopolysaccharide/colanic/teichoic acid biosynthesis glycosyltransferase
LIKRAFDVVTASVLFVVTGPISLCLAALVRVTSPGPILFRARRLGRDGIEFTLFKFRSMTAGAEGPTLTASDDVRVTAVGRVLRKSKLDELPQLINVLRGEMSLVGPRPEDPRFLPYYGETFRDVLSVRPGLTGVAAIAFRHEESLLAGAHNLERTYVEEILPQKLALELEYVRNQSLAGDVRLLFRTVAAVFRRPSRSF